MNDIQEFNDYELFLAETGQMYEMLFFLNDEEKEDYLDWVQWILENVYHGVTYLPLPQDSRVTSLQNEVTKYY